MYEGAAILMFDFQQKVEALRRYESLCYTLCLTLLIEEQAACKAAEKTLCKLFEDQDFWHKPETERSSYLLRICTRECMQWKGQVLSKSS